MLGRLERLFTARDGDEVVLTARLAPESRAGVVVRISDVDRPWSLSALASIDAVLRDTPGVESIRWFDASEWADPDCDGRPYPM